VRVTVNGEGPALLLIECNVPWDPSLIHKLAEWFTVVKATPTGFVTAERRPAGEYALEDFERELLSAVDSTGADSFSILGYSMSAAFGAWLARRTRRVDTLVAGGFPLFGDYRLAVDHVRARLDRQDEAALGADPSAARLFWEDLETLDLGALAHPLSARLALFLGSEDSLVDQIYGVEEAQRRASSQGIPFLLLEGADHQGGFLRMIEIVDWIRACITMGN
jgi:pimeloyl-ACP methyl ester carboxylesterase